MKEHEIISLMNENWDENGFFEKLRYPNQIDLEQGNKVLKSLEEFTINEEDHLINKELVRLLWYIPQFMDWQEEKLVTKNTEDMMKSYKKISGEIRSEVERILGYP